MVIGLTVLASLFTPLQCHYNRLNSTKYSPFLFISLTIALLFGLYFATINLNISILCLQYLTYLLFSCVVVIFAIFYIKKWKIIIKKNNLIYFFRYLPLLLILLFFALFWLFYIKKIEPYQSDMFLHYRNMEIIYNSNSNGIVNLLNHNSLATYWCIGFYKLGDVLNLSQRLLLMPYFCLYFLFYVVITTTFYIFDKYIKNIWLLITFLLVFSILYYCLYIYLNIQNAFTDPVGDIIGAFIPSLILIPSFNNLVDHKIKIEIILLFILCVFFNETSLIAAILLSFLYLCWIVIFRNKYYFSFVYFSSFILFFIFILYLGIYQALTLFTFIYFHLIAFSWFINFFFWIWILGSISLLFFRHIYRNKIKQNFVLKIYQSWYFNSEVISFRWFNKNKLLSLLKIFFIILVIVFFTLDLFFSRSIYPNYNDFLPLFLLIDFAFIGLFIKLILSDKLNGYALYYLIFIVVSVIIALIIQNDESSNN